MSHFALYATIYLAASFGLAILVGKAMAFGMGTDLEEQPVEHNDNAIPVTA